MTSLELRIEADILEARLSDKIRENVLSRMFARRELRVNLIERKAIQDGIGRIYAEAATRPSITEQAADRGII